MNRHATRLFDSGPEQFAQSRHDASLFPRSGRSVEQGVREVPRRLRRQLEQQDVSNIRRCGTGEEEERTNESA